MPTPARAHDNNFKCRNRPVVPVRASRGTFHSMQSKSRESQRSSTSHKHAMPVQLRPLGPFQRSVSSVSRAPACRAEGRGSKARTDRQFPRARSDRRQHGRLAPGRRRSVTVRVHHFKILGDVTVACRPVKADAMVQNHPGEPVSTPARCNSIAYAASNGRGSRCKSWCGYHFQRSTSGIDEETVSKAAAPHIGVQSAIASSEAMPNAPGA